jgi:homogentisate phytyltransferase / homogentisate geranylgeranyltransferase
MSQVSGQKFSFFRGSWLYSFWKFSRPHTVIGTSLSVLALYLIAIASAHSSPNTHLGQLLLTWASCVCGNIYIVGLNQLEDVAIDKINKPDLPIASGEFSEQAGQIIVAITGFLAMLIAWFGSLYLFGMVVISLTIGTCYSLPPIRLKRFPFWAAICIFSVRGAIVNLGLFLHFSQVLQQNQTIPSTVWVLTVFILVFTFAIAIFKDIPDIEGDRLYNITTLTIQLGSSAVFNLALWVLTFCYAGMILVGVLRLASINPVFLVISHLLLLGTMWFRSWVVDLQDKSAIARFYQFIWKLFFIEYLIFPLACLLA